MSLSRASLYGGFGNKDALFVAAIDHYGRTYSEGPLQALAEEGDAAAEVNLFLDRMIDLVTGDPDTPGCLIACVLSEAATVNPTYRALLAQKTQMLEARIERSLRANASMSKATDLSARSGLVAATARGLAISARAGVPARRLREVGRMAAQLACSPTAGV